MQPETTKLIQGFLEQCPYICNQFQVSAYIDDTGNLTLLPRYNIIHCGCDLTLGTSDFGTRLRVFTKEERDGFIKRLLEEPVVDIRHYVNVWNKPKE